MERYIVNFVILQVTNYVLIGDTAIIDNYCTGAGYDTYCFWTTNQTGSFDDVRSYCENDGGKLTYFHSQEMEEYIYHNRDKEVFKDYTWIYVGITDKQTEGTWLAIGDKKVSWLNFAGDQPDGGTQENCLFMQLDKTGYKLRDINCVNYDIHGLCGKKIIVSPNVFTAKRGKLNNHVFRSFQAYSVSHCTLNCFQTDSCQSCNYDKTTHTCQLNGMTREMASLADFSNFGGLYLSFKTKEESI